ncbi:MAG: TIGR01777 family oxidoreductase [Terriglobales bacterium]
MRVLITGATGLIGQALIPALRREGWEAAAWVRSPDAARRQLGAGVELFEAGAGLGALAAALAHSDAVVNLAGETLLARRWNAARREVLRDSRVGVTQRLVEAMAAAARPRVLISGSAVGYYGDRGAELLPETAAPGADFLARLCQDWESAAEAAAGLGARVVRLRCGVVLSRAGGALAQMLPPFRLGLGGPVGDGRQYLSWIHLDDLVRMVLAALADYRYCAAVNAVAPEPATSRDFARALGRALHRPAVLPIPALALRARFGSAATVVLASQRAAPQALRSLGFDYRFPTLDAALADLLG